MLSAGFAAPLMFPETLRSAEPEAPSLESYLPFAPDKAPKTGREVFAHWHFFPISLDNRPSDGDYYSAEFLTPKNSSGENFGSLLRERPLPRPPRDTSSWVIDDMESDIHWALEIGVDAFLYNIINIDPKSHLWQMLGYMLDAATRVGSAFRVAPNLDATLLAHQPVAKIAAAIKSISDHPMLLRRAAGQLVLGAFAAETWPVENWTELFSDLAKSGIKIEFLPTFLNVRGATPGHWKIADVVSEWSGNYLDGVGNLDQTRAIVGGFEKSWCAPVWAQDFRPKNGIYGEAANSRLFREAWMSAINGSAERVQLITWNDYSESSAIRPSTGIQYSFYDLAAYYIDWFKSGRQPAILRDVLYYFHRVQPTDGSALGTAQTAPFSLQWGRRPVNDIELLAFLTEAGELEIVIGGNVHRMSAAAGMTSMRAPLANGRPSFRLKRGGAIVIDFQSAYTIGDRAEFQNLLYHGGSSARTPATAE